MNKGEPLSKNQARKLKKLKKLVEGEPQKTQKEGLSIADIKAKAERRI
jgi:hypothetical protein